VRKKRDVLPAEGLLDPDPELHSLISRIEGDKDYADKHQDAFRRAMIDLLRNRVPINMPLSQYMRDQMAAELEQLWWPKAGRPALASPENLRYLVNRIEALNRGESVDRPRTRALEDAKEFFGYRSVEAVRKAMQPSRHRRPKPA
jgi:hypothetical protein